MTSVEIASAVWIVVATYGALGISFGAFFVAFGVERVDHAAKGAPWSFRLLILPAVAALWPMMLVKWRRAVRASAP